MKRITIFQCSHCGNISGNYNEIFDCELGRIGISKEEYNEWILLRKQAEQAGYRVGVSKNPQTDKAFDDAIKKLIDFEKAHDLQNTSFPSLN